MITLLHGDLIEASRTELNRLKEASAGQEIRVLDGRGVTETALTQAIESNSLFGGGVTVVIENMFGKLGRKTKLIESLAAILNAADPGVHIILWEDKEVGATVQKSLSKADVRTFKLPPIIFQFLDGLAPHSARSSLALYEKLIATEASELAFSMIVRRVRQLIQLLDGVTPDRLQSWQATRLTRQAKLFSMEKLLSMHNTLLLMEYSTKNGSSPFTLAQLTQQFIIDL